MSDEPDLTICEELESVFSLIQAHAKQQSSPPTLAIIRLVTGLSLSGWEEIVAERTLPNWLALPLDATSAEATEAVISLQNKLIFERDHDALTGILNRGCFDKVIKHEFERAYRTQNELSLIIIDIDDFKKVNDTYGHPTGDIVLQRLAKTLSKKLASFDSAARIGGEEFALLFPATSCWTAQEKCLEILRNFRQEEFFSPKGSFSVTFSAGVASLSLLDGLATPDMLFSCADEALYDVKRKGKNDVAIAQTCRLTRDHETLVQSHEKQLLFSPDTVE